MSTPEPARNPVFIYEDEVQAAAVRLLERHNGNRESAMKDAYSTIIHHPSERKSRLYSMVYDRLRTKGTQ